MGIFDIFRSDPTSEWPAPSAALPLFDADACRFELSVGIGDPILSLRKFGRPSNPHAIRAGRFDYPALGLRIEATNEKDPVIDSIDFVIRDRDGEGFEGAEVTLQFAVGASIRLAAGAASDVFIDRFGEPTSVDRDSDEIVYTFERPDRVWDIECDRNEQIARVSVYQADPGA